MPKKNYFDFSLFDEVGDAMDLFGNLIRKSFKYDSLEDKDTFLALVLTRPIPLDIRKINFFIGDADPDGTDNLPKFLFKARIIGSDSPHLFLPDPCDPVVLKKLSDQQRAQDIIDLHTTVIGVNTSDKPNIGNIVRIRLEPGTYKYNIQSAQLVEIVSNKQKSTRNLLGANAKECFATLAQTFNKYQGGVIGDTLSDRGISYVKHFDADAPRLLFPVRGVNSVANGGSRMGFRIHPVKKIPIWHNGIDIGGGRGREILAAADGTVQYFRNDIPAEGCPGCATPAPTPYSGAGNYIVLKHQGANGQTFYTRYLHLLHKGYPGHQGGGVLVKKVGQVIRRGEVIGLEGSTGSSTGPHLHFELLRKPYDPGNGLNPIFHFESMFDDSIAKKQLEESGAGIQADKEFIANAPMETLEGLETEQQPASPGESTSSAPVYLAETVETPEESEPAPTEPPVYLSQGTTPTP